MTRPQTVSRSGNRITMDIVGDETPAEGLEDIRTMISHVDLNPGRSTVLVLYKKASVKLNAQERRNIADLLEENQPILAPNVAATAVVVKTALQAGVIQMISWFVPHKFPNKTFTDIKKAEAFLDSILPSSEL